MKKSLFILLVLAGFSAYALNSNRTKNIAKPHGKTPAKKVSKHTISPLADLLSFSFLH